MASKDKKNVVIKVNPSSDKMLKESQSQTDASEWVEYEMDMNELYENLKEEGIDVPLDEFGKPIFSPEFIKKLPPSVQPHAGGKAYAGGKPFKSTLAVGQPVQGALGREIQTRTSIWEEYKKELKEFYTALEKNGVQVPMDEEGVPILTEDLLKSLPPEDVPHPGGKEFTPISGIPPLPDGTRVSPRLTLRLLTPALESELVKQCEKRGITVPMKNGKPDITAEFIQSIPPELLQSVLQPLYDNQQQLSEKRESVINKLSLEKKNSLKTRIEKKGIEVKMAPTGEPIIPTITIMQFTEDELSEAVGEEISRDIVKPAPKIIVEAPQDTMLELSREKRQTLGKMLLDQGLSVDVDADNVPIITKTNAAFLPQEALEEFKIDLADIMPAENTTVPDESKPETQRRSKKQHHFNTGQGIFHLSRKKNLKEKIVKRSTMAGVEVIMTEEGEVDLTDVPNVIVDEFTTQILKELQEIDAEEMRNRINAMSDDDRELVIRQMELAGMNLPIDEKGNKMITTELIEKMPRDELTNLLAKIFSSQNNLQKEKDGAEEGSHKLSVSGEGEASEEFELELTDTQKEEFREKLAEEGIKVPLDKATGRPRFTREFVRNVPKNLARDIISAAATNEEDEEKVPSHYSVNTVEDSDYDLEEKKSHHTDQEEKAEEGQNDLVLGIRYSHGINYIADAKGKKVKYEKLVQCLQNAYSDSELKKHDEYNHEKEADLRAAIREERRREEKDHTLKRAESDLEIQQMAMRFIPRFNPYPQKTDPIDLFDHTIPTTPVVQPQEHVSGAKGVDFVHIMEPSSPTRKLDSLATLPSTVARKFSIESFRGSALSTRLSDMPSMFSQALIEEPSTAFITTASTQEFNITRKSVSAYREKWLSSFMSGFTPKQTFTISIINMITRKQIELRVCKENTMNEICHMYMQYEDHPEYYVWKDIYGRLLLPDKTLIENGLMRQDEVLEFQGYRRLPVILLYFRDGFENDPPLPLNPLHALKQREPGLCRNY